MEKKTEAMIRENPRGERPKIHASAYIDPSAVIIGNVTIGRNVFVGPGAVIRADEENSAVRIRDNCNVQDRAVIHALGGTRVLIGESASLSHGCIVHGPCRIGRKCFIGFGSVVFNARLGEQVVVRHLVAVEGARVPSKRVVSRPPASGGNASGGNASGGFERLDAATAAFSEKVVKTNLALVKGYAAREKTR
ncbi:MAG: LbetaH domain-containing protein [Endomicrobiales bacterium]